MLNVHLSYKTPSSWRILFWSGVPPRQFSHLKKFMALVFPGGGFRKGEIIQGILTPMRVLPNGQWRLRRKGDITGESVDAPIQRNSMYIQTVNHYIYKTRRPKHPNSPIRKYKKCPLGPFMRPRYNLPIMRTPSGHGDRPRRRRIRLIYTYHEIIS